jgi:hypothetical protein
LVIIIGLVTLVAAVVAGVAGVLSDSGSGHALTQRQADGRPRHRQPTPAGRRPGRLGHGQHRAGRGEDQGCLRALTGPVRGPAEFRYAMGQAVTDAGPTGAGLLYGAGPAPSRLAAHALFLGVAGGRRAAAGP